MNWIPLGLDDVIGASAIIGLLTFGLFRFVAEAWFDLYDEKDRLWYWLEGFWLGADGVIEREERQRHKDRCPK